jgi:SET domain-containing protein
MPFNPPSQTNWIHFFRSNFSPKQYAKTTEHTEKNKPMRGFKNIQSMKSYAQFMHSPHNA